ncbi:MAG: hypothetical protein RL572_183 [Pseudomonadota bacterium]|jgi:hypothetical protein
MLVWIETTSVAQWVSLSLYAYPLLLCVHIIGLAVVVGIFMMRDLRLAGFFKGLDPLAFLPLGRVAWLGFFFNALSGLALFSSQAQTFAGNAAFLIKIAFILLGMILACVIEARLRAALQQGSAWHDERFTRTVALCSLLTWTGAIIAGRLVAYIV